MISDRSKKVMLVIIDALTSRTFFPALESGELPTFQRMLKGGTVRRESISIFPSLTPAATSTIITGAQPDKHRVFGFHWFDRSTDEVAYYGDDFWTIAEMGFANFFNECLCSLNQKRLSAKTIFSKVKEHGQKAASLNYLMFQGQVPHTAQVPLWFSWHPKVPFAEDIQGPDLLFFGDFVDSSEEMDEDAPSRKSGIFGRFGFNDDNTGELLKWMAQQRAFPEFTLAYFPDHDYDCHDRGPRKGIETVAKLDAIFADFIEIYGGVEKVLKDFNIVITGDHAQSDIVDDVDEATIKVNELFADFNFSNAKGWEEEETLKVFPDMRCAQVYLRHRDDEELRTRVVQAILKEPRVDQIMWQERERFHIQSAERGKLIFWESSEGSSDAFGRSWKWDGDLAVLDATDRDGELEFGDYPNAFERIAGAIAHNDSGDIWMTSKLGCEFSNRDSETHVGGGSHGSLHRADSESPLLIAGVDLDSLLPKYTRLTDVEPLCLYLLGLLEHPPVSTREKVSYA